eukprot:1629967-Prymnesium_polylepis.1
MKSCCAAPWLAASAPLCLERSGSALGHGARSSVGPRSGRCVGRRQAEAARCCRGTTRPCCDHPCRWKHIRHSGRGTAAGLCLRFDWLPPTEVHQTRYSCTRYSCTR